MGVGPTHVNNNVNFAINMGICMVTNYYYANNIGPRQNFNWDGMGEVWYSVVIIPWIDKESEFVLATPCGSRWSYYRDKVKKAAKEIAQHGEGKLGHLQIIGKNLTFEEASDRLMNLAYWGDGLYVADRKITITGGPGSYATKYKSIDISDNFDKICIYIEKI